jgi:hypothetical protein
LLLHGSGNDRQPLTRTLSLGRADAVGDDSLPSIQANRMTPVEAALGSTLNKMIDGNPNKSSPAEGQIVAGPKYNGRTWASLAGRCPARDDVGPNTGGKKHETH